MVRRRSVAVTRGRWAEWVVRSGARRGGSRGVAMVGEVSREGCCWWGSRCGGGDPALGGPRGRGSMGVVAIAWSDRGGRRRGLGL